MRVRRGSHPRLLRSACFREVAGRLRSTATRLQAVRRRSLAMRIVSAAHAFIVNVLRLTGWGKKVGEGR